MDAAIDSFSGSLPHAHACLVVRSSANQSAKAKHRSNCVSHLPLALHAILMEVIQRMVCQLILFFPWNSTDYRLTISNGPGSKPSRF